MRDFSLTDQFVTVTVTVSSYFLIFSRIGIIWSNVGRFPGSSFMQILISFAMCGEIPGLMSSLSPSVAILIPVSMGVRSLKGISLVDISHNMMA